MLESSLEMAAKLRIPAVAEGVENQAQWDLLRELRCSMAQGYFVAKPMEAGDFLQWAEIRKKATIG
jgi:EAL domain-containing protein (putative c-di-GMP-specific phosphodiesterase class I)